VEVLSFESVDELEEALDALEGIAPDGGDLDTALADSSDALAVEEQVRGIE
jgi:hypothetical protein